MNKTIKAQVSGKVQGVWFRASTKYVAEKLGLNGYAKNLANGDVEVMASGNENKLNDLVNFLSSGPELAVVTNVQWQWVDETDFSLFEVL